MDANTRLEHAWALATTHTIVWPAGAPDTERLAAACAEVAASARPGSYTAGRVAAAASAEGTTPWRFLDRSRDRFVCTSGERDLDAFVAALTRRAPDPVLPFWFVVCPGGFAMVHSHELGDGSVSAALLEAVLRAHDGALPARGVPDRVARDRDLARALGSLWLRRPRTVVDTATGVARRFRRRPATQAVVDATTAVRLETWGPDEADVSALDRWRRAVPARPSLSVALLWTVARALAAHGHPAGPQAWQVVVGMRGGAPELAGFGGNLVGRALVDVDPAGDPAGPFGQLRRQSASGEIIALHLAKAGVGAAGEALRQRRGRAAGPAAARIGGSPGLSWSDRGRFAFGDGFASTIPAAASGPPRAYTAVTPCQSGIGVNVNWVDGRPGVLITFGASPLDDAAVDAVTASLRSGVEALLGVTPAGAPAAVTAG